MKRILLIAFHYPPVKGSSGLQRTLAFSQYLSQFGWQPAVLSINPRAYNMVSDEQVSQIPEECQVVRAFGLNSSRHLSLFGRYPRWAALPDNWATWFFGAVPSGLKMIRRFSPDVIWSTYPIASAHLIGCMLHKLSGVPWVADFRDSMTEETYPVDPTQRRVYRWIEKKTVTHCKHAVFTTPGAREMYASRYPDLPDERWSVIANGYDDRIFSQVEAGLGTAASEMAMPNKGPLYFVHSGVLYPEERDPRQFYGAVRSLLLSGEIFPEKVQIMLRATGHDEYHSRLIQEFKIGDIVKLGAPLPYREALKEMMLSHGLLLFQADNCDHQIPAKLYEYVRARRPVFAMTNPLGNTAGELILAGYNDISPLNDEKAITASLMKFIREVETGTSALPNADSVMRFDRRARAGELASLLDGI